MELTKDATVTLDERLTHKIACEAVIKRATKSNGVIRGNIPIVLLTSADYQRELDMSRVRKIAAEWDDYKCDEVLVSYRDGKFYVVNGQHRTKAAEMIGKEEMYCKIYTSLTYEEEAILFAIQNRHATVLSNKARFKSLVIGKDKESLALQEICDKHKVFTPKDKKKEPYLAGLRSAQLTLHNYGIGAVDWIFDTIDACGWHDVPKAYSQQIIVMLRKLYVKHIYEAESGAGASITVKIIKVLNQTTPALLYAVALSKYPNRTVIEAGVQYIEDQILD